MTKDKIYLKIQLEIRFLMFRFILFHGGINEPQLCNPRKQIATVMY